MFTRWASRWSGAGGVLTFELILACKGLNSDPFLHSQSLILMEYLIKSGNPRCTEDFQRQEAKLKELRGVGVMGESRRAGSAS